MIDSTNTPLSAITVVKLVIETTSPMAISTGFRETLADTQIARDVNGLPRIPASSFAGVWRHLATQSLPYIDVEHYFGYTSDQQSAASNIIVSDGRILDSKHRKVPNYVDPNVIDNDPVLRLCKRERPLQRDGVAINDRGVAKEKNKYDKVMLPTGLRFTLNIEVKQNTTDEVSSLLALLNDSRFALGSSTRNGLGQFAVVQSEVVYVVLGSNPNAGQELQHTLQRACANENALSDPQYQPQSSKLLAEIPLQAIDNWRCGRGSQLLGPKSSDSNVSIISYSEPKVVWRDQRATLSQSQPVLCGSSVKGMIAHRVAFHYRKHQHVWAESMADASHEEWQKRPDALNKLFGFAEDDTGKAGRLVVLDSPINVEHIVTRHHNAIDRFTGGVRQGALFTEELLYQPSFTITLLLLGDEPISEPLQLALTDTLEDIELGLLSIGAGSGRGTSMTMLQADKSMVFNKALLQGAVE